MGPLECTDSQRVTLAVYLLEGEAENWWSSMQRGVPAGYAWTWAGFRVKFLEKYFPRSCRSAKIAQFLKLEQGNMTVAQYEAKFEELSQYMPKALKDEENKLEKFKEGLKPGIQSRLCTWDFGGFPELVDKAMRVEKDFECTICSFLPTRDAPFIPRQPPPALPVPAGRPRPLVARAPPFPPGGGCGYCGKVNHTTQAYFQ
ncbi:uncharacterized protein LOC131244151 [Magnolia sinica]|uniref:uncharacterized protein LOC131244151 n=1 Tax=Magnolia sinica TaxID=86752 RepID=UPI00265A166F|nr:uncharacterized protein LOC131244151 [Magnolia sinica]